MRFRFSVTFDPRNKDGVPSQQSRHILMSACRVCAMARDMLHNMTKIGGAYLVLRGEATLAGNVHHQQHLILE